MQDPGYGIVVVFEKKMCFNPIVSYYYTFTVRGSSLHTYYQFSSLRAAPENGAARRRTGRLGSLYFPEATESENEGSNISEPERRVFVCIRLLNTSTRAWPL